MAKSPKPSPKQAANQITDDDLALLAELGIDTTTPESPKRTPREERIIAGFEDIERFVEEHDRLPQHGDDRDIFERIYATRLDRLRELEECRALLQPLDSRGLLDATAADFPATDLDNLDDAELLAELGIDLDAPDAKDDITRLKYVRSRQEIKAAEEIAQRKPCEDFANFKPTFQQVQQDLARSDRQTTKYQDNASIDRGDLFILDGHTVLVAEMGEEFTADYGLPNRRLRLIYDNGTENDLLLRSFQRALNKDKTSRRISKTIANYGPLFAQVIGDDLPKSAINNETTTGHIYVLRSQSDDPFIAAHRSLVHKIGVTSGEVNKRLASAQKDPTYLLAEVETVAIFELSNINPQKLETLLHRFFEAARLDMKISDRFGNPVKPREWFFVPLDAIEEAICAVRNGNLDRCAYDPEQACIVWLS